ncbi:MAG: PKD domain-containing protein [Flavobacteriia bacterium]|nr:PKD domain-containing protein [Flavobacteriia bacterium]
MKRTLLLLIILAFGASDSHKPQLDARSAFAQFLDNHPFSKRERISPEELKQMPKQDRPDLAWEQDYLATLDPALGRPTPEVLLPIYQQVAAQQQLMTLAPGSAASPWMERGPNNVGGRTRALMWDPNSTSGNKVWAGGVTGGLWYNNDITNSNSSWVAVGNFWDNISITDIVYDPTDSSTFYVSTGEGWGVGAARGEGIWKSTDAGATWSHLSSTSNFRFINDLMVRNENGTGVLYAACSYEVYAGSAHGNSTRGLQRSLDGGLTWTQVLPNVPGRNFPYFPADIELATNNRIWVGTMRTHLGSNGGTVLYSDDGTNWTIAHTVTSGDRVELACAPSDSNYIYAVTEVLSTVEEIARSTDGGLTWNTVTEPVDADNGIPATDFTRGQAWYDLILAVDPNDPNTVIAGGIDLFRSTDGGLNWSQISKWSNNNNLASLNCSYVHADQHQVVFKPGSSSIVIFGTDGGVFYTSSLSNAATSNVISARNKDYNITQFYSCAIHPTAGQDYYLAGAQDNGTQRFQNAGINGTTMATDGDGGFCFIDQTNASYQVTAYVYNSYWRSTNGGNSWGTRIQTNYNTGRFINPTDYDDVQNILYSARTTTTINRIKNITGSPSVSNFTVNGMTRIATHLRVSPYTTSSTTLFVGNDVGDLFKITNADGTSPSTTNIGSSSFPSATISCVEIGASENELLVTFSNYGVNSVWYTNDGGTTWTSKEGNLPNMPVRWALFNPNDRNEVILATEVGVWTTANLSATSPTWASSNSGLANVRVDMLQIRDSDNQVIAATHGRGLFSSDAFAPSLPPTANFGVSNVAACINETISLYDSSAGAPSTFLWDITPSTFTYVNGTNASSQNPEVQFTSAGNYTVELKATNTNGIDSITKSNIIRIGGLPLPFSEDFEGGNSFTISNPDNNVTWSMFTVGGTSPGNTAAGVDFYNYGAIGARDGLISPSLDFSGYTSVYLDFEYAYRRYTNLLHDSMAIFVSTDCGNTYTRVASFKNTYATGADQTSLFTPSSASDWCGNTIVPNCPSIDLSAFAGQAEVRIKFESINGYGNRLYIDNINVAGTTVSQPVADFSASDSSVCTSNSVQLTDLSQNSPTAWQWSFSPSGSVQYVNGSSTSQNPEVLFTASGTYSVTMTATNSAGSNTVTKSSLINVGSVSISAATPSATLCKEDTAMLTGNPLGGVFYGNGVNGQVFSASAAGTGQHWVYYSYNDTAGCEGIDSVSILVDIVPKPTISRNGVTLSCNESGYSYQWFLNGNSAPGVNNTQSYTPTVNGNYTVSISTNDCSDNSDSYNVNDIGYEELKSLYGFTVYPNPTIDVLRIHFEMPQAESALVEIFSLNGQCLLRREVTFHESFEESISLRDFATGLYTLKISCGRTIFVESVEKY